MGDKKIFPNSLRRALLRVDFNVPINKGEITDFTRIETALPTIRHLLNLKYNIVIITHLGRPNGWDPDLSLHILVAPLSKMLGREVFFYDSNILNSSTKELPLKEITLLENIRFYTQETSNDFEFSKNLAAYGDIYVNDAFGVSHRKHASVYGIRQFFKSKYMGKLVDKELKELNKIKKNPQHPLTLVIGGSKVSSKIKLLDFFLDLADNIIIGGGMAFPFIKLSNGQIGKSLCKDSELELAKSFVKKTSYSGTKIILPVDCVSSTEISNNSDIVINDIRKIPSNYMGLDIGPKSIELFSSIIFQSKSILWNGPMGVFEIAKFSGGTDTVAKAIVKQINNESYCLAGGGDTLSAISNLSIGNKFSYLSTGGGAMLEFFQENDLPGVLKLQPLKDLHI